MSGAEPIIRLAGVTKRFGRTVAVDDVTIDVPRGRWASFNEAWNVWIDGRLARRGTPSLTRNERWTAFHGEFRRRGRRRAWFARIFDHLWRADRLSQQDLLDAVDVLVG